MPSDSVLQQIRERLDYESFYGRFLTLHGTGAERTARCVFHDDRSPSLSVNVHTGLFFCHSPECAARGNEVQFFMRVRSMSFSEAVAELGRIVGLDTTDRDGIIDEAIVDAAHRRLLNTPAALEYLQERRGLTRATVERWQLGYDGQRYFIPIRDELNRCVNIRRYRPDARRAQDKMLSWRAGYGGARIWPFDSFRENRSRIIVIHEGEMDCLLSLQTGFAAITATGGAGTWRDEWDRHFAGRNVAICYDVDEAGRTGAQNVARHLHGVASSVRVVQLPLTEPVGADFTDYVVGHGHGADDFDALILATPLWSPAPASNGSPSEPEPVHLHLSQASRAEHYNGPIRIDVMVSGKTTSPYLVPQEVRLSCGMPGLRMCERCPVARAAGSTRVELEFESNELLHFVSVPDSVVEKQLKAKIGIPPRCTYVEAEVERALNVEEVQLIPEVDRSDDDAPYVTRLAYYVGHGLQANRSYLMTGLTVPDPRRQLATHLISAAVPAQSNIDAFRITDDVIDRLRIFNPDSTGDVDGLWAKLEAIYGDLENAIRIYQRRDLMLAVDLTFHSILAFRFQGERLTRGWIEALVIGDSRTGKTTIVERLVNHYRAGEISSGENTSLAGLVGGLHQIGTSWALQWGKVPLNDRRLIVIDEAGNLPPEQIARMSSMRSSGIAEIVKVHTERTNSRTRQVWISNPRGMKPLSSYSQGVQAVKELIGAPEDIARFDLVITAASDDVTLSVINAARPASAVQTYTSELCHQRVMWAWSRGTDDVVWAGGAERDVLELATEQGERYRYATEVPLVEPNEQRIKLARLAVAAAALFFSTEDGYHVVVRPEHVRFAHDFLERLYEKPSLAFREYAEIRRRRYAISEEETVRGLVLRQPDAPRLLMEQEQFTQRDLSEILGIDDRESLRGAVTVLRNSGFLRRSGASYYLKTAAAINWLRRHLTRAMDSMNGNGARQVEARLDDDELPPW